MASYSISYMWPVTKCWPEGMLQVSVYWKLAWRMVLIHVLKHSFILAPLPHPHIYQRPVYWLSTNLLVSCIHTVLDCKCLGKKRISGWNDIVIYCTWMYTCVVFILRNVFRNVTVRKLQILGVKVLCNNVLNLVR